MGVKIAQKNGIKLAVATGRDSPALRRRLDDLGIESVRLGCIDKAASLRELMEENQVIPEETLFIGDDITDEPAFAICALGVAPADAANSTRSAAHFITGAYGGRGVLREVIDKIVEVRKKR